jgi:hypothetical protein
VTLVVRTACLKSSAARRDDALDVTRGTGTGDALAFAPSAALLSWAKGEGRAGRLERAWPLYRQRYLDEMDESRATNHGPWNKLLARRSVTLSCYCENALRCHRYLLGSIVLVGLGAAYEGEAES